MNTTYIAQCAAAFGTAEGHKIEGGWLRHHADTNIIITDKGEWYYKTGVDLYVPVKTQEQLQKMVGGELDTLSQLQGVWIFVNSFKLEPSSMEELWLRYVMYQLYNKTWDKGVWV